MSEKEKIELPLYNRFDVQIDEHRLDEEWVGQPTLYFEYAEKLADARRELNEAKNELEVVKAEAAQSVRADPGNFGLAKLTERAVDEVVPTQGGVKDAQASLVHARHNVDVLDGAVAALDHRRKALEKLVELYLSNYYSKPRAKGATKERMEDVEKRAVRRRGKRTDQ